MRILTTKHAETYKKMEKLSFFAFLSNLPNFLIISFSAFSAGTVVVWVDTFVSLGETLHSMIVWLVSRKMYRESGDKYNFGLGRLEVFISFICDLLVAFGMVGVLFGTILSFSTPSSPNSSLIWFCLLKICNSIYDLVFYIKQTKICHEHSSKLNETEKITYRDSLINDVAVAIVALICYFFRSYSFIQYFSPIVSIILALYFISIYIRHIKSSVAELSDVSLPIKTQDEIYDVVLEKRELIKKIVSVNCRRLNGKAHIEISLIMQDSATYSEMTSCLDEIKKEIENIEPNADVLLVIGSPIDE